MNQQKIRITVCKFIADIIPYRMLAISAYICMKFSVTVNFMELGVKKPKILLFNVK